MRLLRRMRAIELVAMLCALIAGGLLLVWSGAKQSTTYERGAVVVVFISVLSAALAALYGAVLLHHFVRRARLQGAAESPSPVPDSSEQLHARQAELTELSRHLIRVAEEEKAELARELHDVFGSNLTAINMDLNWIARRLPADRPELSERLRRSLLMLSTTVESQNSLIDRLRPSQLDNLGLAEAIRCRCTDLANRSGLPCKLDAAEDFDDLDRNSSIALYRVAQHALANAEQHARAHVVDVKLRREGRGVRLLVCDDGVGVAPEVLSRVDAHGLLDMRERVAALGGTLSVSSVDGRGTVVEAFVPA